MNAWIRLNAAKTGLGGLALFGLAALSSAQEPVQEGTTLDRANESPLARTMGIRQRLGETLPLDTKFRDEDGKTVEFGSLLSDRPVVVVPVFYACQTACSIITDNIMKVIAKAEKTDRLRMGRDLDIIFISLHPKETPDLARVKKQLILNALTPSDADASWRPRMEKSWHLLTGDWPEIQEFVTGGLGVKFKYDDKKNLINHPTCTVFVSPQGKISAYTIGNGFPTRLIETNLEFAERNDVAPRADQTMMFGCIMLDPETGRMRPVVQNIMRVLGVFTILAVAGLIVTMNIQSKRKNPLGGGDLGVR